MAFLHRECLRLCLICYCIVEFDSAKELYLLKNLTVYHLGIS